MAKNVKASKLKCSCGEQAVAFWPVIDPDIPANPYCRKCLDEAQIRILMKIGNDDYKNFQ